MKAFIYYSYIGNGDYVAKYMEQRGYLAIKVTPKHDLGKKKFFAILFGGLFASLNLKFRLKNFGITKSLYDEIVVGSPIWNNRVSCPINTVMDTLKDYKGKIKFIFYAGGGQGSKATIKVSRYYADARSIVLREPKSHPEELNKLNSFL